MPLVGMIAPTTAAVTPQTVQAYYIIETYYYSDSTYTQQVGFSFRGCKGNYVLSGQTSPYDEQFTEPCY